MGYINWFLNADTVVHTRDKSHFFFHYFLNTLSGPFSLFSLSETAIMYILVPHASSTFYTFYHSFTFCSFDCIISNGLSSNSLILSSAGSSVLLSSLEFFVCFCCCSCLFVFKFSYCIFQLHEFCSVLLKFTICLLNFSLCSCIVLLTSMSIFDSYFEFSVK